MPLSFSYNITNSETHNTSTALVRLIESGINSVCWVEYLHLVLSRAGEMQHKHCGIYCDSLKVEQTVFIIAIEWSVCT